MKSVENNLIQKLKGVLGLVKNKCVMGISVVDIFNYSYPSHEKSGGTRLFDMGNTANSFCQFRSNSFYWWGVTGTLFNRR